MHYLSVGTHDFLQQPPIFICIVLGCFVKGFRPWQYGIQIVKYLLCFIHFGLGLEEYFFMQITWVVYFDWSEFIFA